MTKNKHFFVINPEAGKVNVSDKISNDINEIFKDLYDEYRIYITKGKKWCD